MNENLNSKMIKRFERDMHKTMQVGYFTNISRLNNRIGIEMFLPTTVDELKANTISRFISEKYDVNAIFFVRNHSIRVFYDQ